MSTVIGTVTLDEDPYWLDEFQSAQAIGRIDYDLDGGVFMQGIPLRRGRKMTLGGDNNRGWQTRTTVEALRAFAVANTNVQFACTYRNTTFQCVFRHEEEPVIEFMPVLEATEPASGNWYYGSIKLRIVG